MLAGEHPVRVDHPGFPPVGAPQPGGDEGGIGDHHLRPLRRAEVPDPGGVQHAAGEPALRPGLHLGLPQVLVLQVPGVAHRRMHVGDMRLVGPGEDAVGDAVVARDHKIVTGHVELFHGERPQRLLSSSAQRNCVDIIAAHLHPAHAWLGSDRARFGRV